MKAISLWQPWASAIPLGHKSIETRHWSTKYRGVVAIHAAKRWTPEQREFAAVERACGRLAARLPFGAIVAIATIVDCRPAWLVRAEGISAVERLYGNYDDGRYAWILSDIKPLQDPVGCIGRQGFWNLGDEVADLVRRMAQP